MDTIKKQRKPGSGGKRVGSGAKTKISAVSISLSIPQTILDKVEELGGNRSHQIVKILDSHFGRLEQMIKEAETID